MNKYNDDDIGSKGSKQYLTNQVQIINLYGNVFINIHIRRYTKWSSQDTRIVKDYFQKYITDTTDTRTTRSLPPKSEVMAFLSKNDILQGHENKFMLVRTKIFNEKKKFINSFKGH